MRPLILVCVVVFSVVMLGVRFAAHSIVDNYGTTGGLVVLAAILGAAYLYDGRQRERP